VEIHAVTGDVSIPITWKLSPNSKMVEEAITASINSLLVAMLSSGLRHIAQVDTNTLQKTPHDARKTIRVGANNATGILSTPGIGG
jgi:hypothetical protein